MIQPMNKWWHEALCRENDPEAMFVVGADAQRFAARTCMSCPVRLRCLADALDRQEPYGVWGGMSEVDRKRMLRKHSNIHSWQAYLLNEVEAVS